MKPTRIFVLAALLVAPLSQAASADDWTPWYSVSDGYKNHIDVRYQKSTLKASDGRCDIKYQFRNRYQDRVSFTYKIIVDDRRVQTERVEELGGHGQTSDGTSYARNTREVWVDISNLRAAGSQSTWPRE
jgi:opacity protein-like surface antigen